MDKNEAVEIMSEWYRTKAPAYEIVFGDLKNREFAVLTPKTFIKDCSSKGIRHLKANGLNSFLYCLNDIINYKEQKNPFNLYKSLAKYRNGVDNMSPVLRFRKQEIEDWNKKRPGEIISYDLFIDVDSPDRQHMAETKEDVHRIHDHLVSFSIPHNIIFSGMGYHLLIPYYVFDGLNLDFDPDSVGSDSIYVVFNKISLWYHENVSELVDKNLHDSMRITKVPYSISFYNDGAYVCWPFSSIDEFMQHSWTDYKIDVFRNFKGYQCMFKRGVFRFGVNEWCPKHTLKFLEALKIEVEKDAVVGVE